MIILPALIYLGLLWLVFARFKLLRFDKVAGLASLIIGIVGITILVAVMNFFQPYTPDGRFYFQTIPIISEVPGRVQEILVKPNQSVKAGEALVRINDTSYRIALETASAAYQKAAAAYEGAKREYERSLELVKKNTISQQDVDLKRDDATACLNQANELQSTLQDAKYNLDRTTITAPSDGFVTHLSQEPGSTTPLMTFVSSSGHDFIAAFSQKVLQEIKVGNPADLTLDAVPGHIFHGTVDRIMPVLTDLQLNPGAVPTTISHPALNPAKAAVVIRIMDDLSTRVLPVGCSAQVCVYTGKSKLTEIIRKSLFRLRAWENYLSFP